MLFRADVLCRELEFSPGVWKPWWKPNNASTRFFMLKKIMDSLSTISKLQTFGTKKNLGFLIKPRSVSGFDPKTAWKQIKRQIFKRSCTINDAGKQLNSILVFLRPMSTFFRKKNLKFKHHQTHYGDFYLTVFFRYCSRPSATRL